MSPAIPLYSESGFSVGELGDLSTCRVLEERVPMSLAWGPSTLRPLGPSSFFSIEAEMPGAAVSPSWASVPAPHLIVLSCPMWPPLKSAVSTTPPPQDGTGCRSQHPLLLPGFPQTLYPNPGGSLRPPPSLLCPPCSRTLSQACAGAQPAALSGRMVGVFCSADCQVDGYVIHVMC